MPAHGDHQLRSLPFATDALDGITQEVVEWHHGTHHKGYVDKRNVIEKSLADPGKADRAGAHANYSTYRALKREETFNASGMILHEVYWDNLGGDGQTDSSSAIVQRIERDFGSFDAWKEDFTTCATASRGWAILCYDPSDGRLHNYLCDFHHDGAVWGAIPLIAVDVWEHAYYRIYGPKRPPYIEAFLKNLHWGRVTERFERLVKPVEEALTAVPA